jgi:hypothetical protein
MIYLVNNLEVYIYNENRISIKDIAEDINISNSQWDFVFDFILDRTVSFYFLGERLDYSDGNLEKCLKLLSEKDLIDTDDYQLVFFKLKSANLLISRKLLSQLWSYYEYPEIIFLVDDNND